MIVGNETALRKAKVDADSGGKAVQFIELDAMDARHFGYMGPQGAQCFIERLQMAESLSDTFAEALTGDGWVVCPQGTGIPHETVAVRFHPPAIEHFNEVSEVFGVEAFYEYFLNDYLKHLSCP